MFELCLRFPARREAARGARLRRAGAGRRPGKRGAPGMIRTCDLCLRRAALYPLSYGRAGNNLATAKRLSD